MKFSFSKMLTVIILMSSFFGCSSDVDESLDRPVMPFRIGHSVDQIKYWETTEGDYSLAEEEDNTIMYQNKENPNIYIYYSIENDVIDKVILGYSCTEENSESVIDSYFGLLKKYDFTVNLGTDDDKTSVAQIFGHKYISDLRCRLVTDFSEVKKTGLILNVMLFYKV